MIKTEEEEYDIGNETIVVETANTYYNNDFH